MGDYSFEPITYDPTGVFIEDTGLSREEYSGLALPLEASRRELLADLEAWHSGAQVPDEKLPLDVGFIDLPERLLEDHQRNGDQSELGQLLSAAERLCGMVDKVVVVGIGGSYMGARSLFEACCHPYHNELSRAERNGHPRMYFAGHTVDNDSMQSLLDLLGRDRSGTGVHDRWGLVVVSKSGGTLEPIIAFRQLLNLLKKSNKENPELIPKLIIPVTGYRSNLFDLVKQLGCDPIFSIPEAVGGRYSILSAVGLAPAAILGLDIRRILEGAAQMNACFRTAAPGENPVLDYTGICHLMEKSFAATIRVLSLWDEGLEALGFWYDQLLSESLGKRELGATPLTVVNTRDLHSRGQQHQEGRRDKLITNVIMDNTRREPLPIDYSDLDQDKLNQLAGKTLTEIMNAALIGTNRAYREDVRPTADIHFPRADEASLGQIYQMLMLATAVEGRLTNINPFGQPGVEGYKKHMRAILGV